MRFNVLALDFDGTIAADGKLDEQARRAIVEIRERGITVVLVTGRILQELRRVLGDLRLFDAIVAENGAVIAHPASGRSSIIGTPPPSEFLRELARLSIQFTAGESVIEATASDAACILALIRQLELPLSISFNRDRLMVLPQAISKATGLREILSALRLSTHNTLAIGDAENDHELISAAEFGVAVAWGSAALKSVADAVLEGSGPAAVADYIRAATERTHLPRQRIARRQLLLGCDEDGTVVSLGVHGRNVLISGDPRTGKSWIAGLLAEQLILRRYSAFVIDPEGDYGALESLPGVVVMGNDGIVPRQTELSRLLRHPDLSVVVDLSSLAHDEKRRYVASLLRLLVAHRRQSGLPHRVVVDEAHYFLNDSEVLELFDLDIGGYTLVTYRASLLRPEILQATEAIIVSRETESNEVEALLNATGAPADRQRWEEALKNLKLDEAVILPGTDEACGTIRKFKIAPRLTSHVRHRHKYFDVPVSPNGAFVFTSRGRPIGKNAQTLAEFLCHLGSVSDEVLDGHLRRGDVSRWVEGVFGDRVLAEQISALEEQYRLKQGLAVRDAISQLIESRYSFTSIDCSGNIALAASISLPASANQPAFD